MADSHLFLDIHHLTQKFSQGAREIVVLDGISYRFEQGRSYAISGDSGAGKSTLLHLLAGLETPTLGQVRLGGKDIADVQTSQIGIVFQAPHLIDELSVLENIMIKGLILKQDYHEAQEQAQELLKRVGLEDKENQRPRSLSGGEQQRVSIARALFTEPAFIIADEPTAHLDQTLSQELLELLYSYQQEKGAGLIIASHDSGLLGLLDTALILHKGTLQEVTPQVSSTYQRVQHGR